MRRALVILTLLTLCFLLVPAVEAAPTECCWPILGQHVVRQGETLFCIGRAYGVDPHAIASTNGIICPNLIYPGVTLNIPDAPATLPVGPTCVRQFEVTPTPTPTETPEALRCGDCTCREPKHVVACGETLTSIALQYGVNMWSIARCNCMLNLNAIRVGQELCIPE